MVSCPPTGSASEPALPPAVWVPDPTNTVTVPVLMIVTSFRVAVAEIDPRAPKVVELVFSGFQMRL